LLQCSNFLFSQHKPVECRVKTETRSIAKKIGCFAIFLVANYRNRDWSGAP